MELDDWVIGQFFHSFLQKIHSKEIGVLFVVDEPEGISDVRIIRLLLTCRLCKGQSDVEIPSVVGLNPGQIVGCWRELGIEFERLFIPSLSLVIFFSEVVDYPE